MKALLPWQLVDVIAIIQNTIAKSEVNIQYLDGYSARRASSMELAPFPITLYDSLSPQSFSILQSLYSPFIKLGYIPNQDFLLTILRNHTTISSENFLERYNATKVKYNLLLHRIQQNGTSYSYSLIRQ